MLLSLDVETGDYDLTSAVTVLTHTPSATESRLCRLHVALGDGTKNLDGTGGSFQFTIKLDGIALLGAAVPATLGATTRAIWISEPFTVIAGSEVKLDILSPNAADTDVDVTARLFDVQPVLVDSTGHPTLASAAISSATFDTGAITAAALAADCITADKIADDAVGADQLAADCITAAHIADDAIGAAQLADDALTLLNGYDADIVGPGDSIAEADRYAVLWHKNGLPVAKADISSPTIQVIQRSDGSDLIGATAMSWDGSDTMLIYDAADDERNNAAEAVLEIVVTATIDSATRTVRRLWPREI